jgi:hypothetical protein
VDELRDRVDELRKSVVEFRNFGGELGNALGRRKRAELRSQAIIRANYLKFPMEIDPTRRYRVLDPKESYSFAKYFEFPYEAEDILADLDCTLERVELNLAIATVPKEQIEFLRTYLQDSLKLTTPVAEISRREFLIAPVVRQLGLYTQARISGEYTIRINQWLKGSLDYFVRTEAGLVIIEAKQSDLTHGFVQLAAELIALDIKTESSIPVLSGVVTSGDLWKFGEFHRQERKVVEDRNLYLLPRDLEQIFGFLVAIAQGTRSHE